MRIMIFVCDDLDTKSANLQMLYNELPPLYNEKKNPAKWKKVNEDIVMDLYSKFKYISFN